MKISSGRLLDHIDYEINSEIYYVPASKEQKNNQKDMTDKNITGNLVFRMNYYNQVYSLPVYEKDNNSEKYQTAQMLDQTFAENEIDYDLVDLDYYFTKNKANMGYEKLVNAIETEQMTYFKNDYDTVQDFTQQAGNLNDWYESKFKNLVENMEHYSEVVDSKRTPFINDYYNVEENNIDYKVSYNPEKQHLYINDIPAIPIEENNNIRLLNDNLSQNMDKTYENINYNFSYNDFKNLEDDSYVYIDLDDYTDDEGKFVENLLQDIPPNEIIKDRFKQNINTFDERINFNALTVYKKDIENFEDRNGLETIDKIQEIKEDYEIDIQSKALNINNDIDKKALSSQIAFNLYDDPINQMFNRNSKLYADYSYQFDNTDLPLSEEDRNEVSTYLNDAKNNFVNGFYKHTSAKSEILANNTLAVLDKAKYNLETDGISKEIYDERKSFYEGMKHATLPLHNITKEDYKDRENDIEIIRHFKSYLNIELEGTGVSEFKPNFINDTLTNGKDSISFNDVLNGSEEKHNDLITNFKKETSLEKDNLEI